jgi:hypothetical protein
MPSSLLSLQPDSPPVRLRGFCVPDEARYRATGGALARFHGACQRDLDRKRPTGITRSATVASRTKAPLDPTEVGPASRKPGVSNPSIRARALADPGDMLPCEKEGRPISNRFASTLSKPMRASA